MVAGIKIGIFFYPAYISGARAIKWYVGPVGHVSNFWASIQKCLTFKGLRLHQSWPDRKKNKLEV